MKTPWILTFLALALGYSSAAHAVTFDFAHIGNAGNAGDVQSQGTFGAVAYNYAISKTEVTNAQYTEFLNAVAGTDTYGLHNPAMAFDSRGGIVQNGTSGNYTYAVKADAQSFTNGNYTYANKPVVYVSWYDSIRFMNWMHNGQGLAGTPSGDTETGAYTLDGGTATPSNGLSITRNASAKYWLPSEDEWYKAAYHDASAGTAGTYFNFATGTNDDPDNFFPTLDAGNSANYRDNGSTTTATCLILSRTWAHTASRRAPTGRTTKTATCGNGMIRWSVLLCVANVVVGRTAPWSPWLRRTSTSPPPQTRPPLVFAWQPFQSQVRCCCWLA